ncbi:retropepsin-like aspartic protease [Pedobacter cryoconitis]|uniref:Peptidase A2 domain-containing protein n=1 Tax=Pedobacter cryoconitis TaxID=188932 RepID=A0A7X0MJ52_9SPHI|nr:retropepsin-like aspartic protease [Pedobacter cryoconitis]MBB6501107.1 hypothetical protein [Pedobacter cryoconitis]
MMIKSLLIALVLLFSGHLSFSQSLPLIRANSEKISIKDGNNPLTRYWDHLNGKVRPLVYSIDKTNQIRTVIFYTDIDSIAFDVFPGKLYNFNVLLRGKDTCHVQLSTVIQSSIHNASGTSGADTIPFILGTDQYIHIKGKINHFRELDLIFDTGASLFVLTEKGLSKSKVILDGSTENQGAGGFSTERTSSRNHLELANLYWKDLPILFYDYKGGLNADGVVGYNVFEDKVVEIDYDKGLLIIHQNLPDLKKDYSELPARHSIEGTFVEATVQKDMNAAKGWFLFDTGGGLTVAVSGNFANKNDLHRRLAIMGYANVSGTGAVVNKTEIAILPELKLTGFVLRDVPVRLNVQNSDYYGKAGIIGNAVLKRFNTIIDYPHGKIYLKPNHLLNTSFEPLKWGRILGIAVIGILMLSVGAFLFVKLKRRKSS